jgi:PEP-CTERM motif
MLNPRVFLPGLLVSAVVVSIAGPAQAETITWDTCAGCAGSYGSGNHGTDPLEFPSSGEGSGFTLRTQAFKASSPFAETVNSIWSGGLGAGGEGTPEHAVDNKNGVEAVIFELPGDGYIPYSFQIGWKNNDADIAAFIGGTLALDLLAEGTSIASLQSLGFEMELFSNVAVNTPQLFTHGASGRYLIIAAWDQDPAPAAAKKNRITQTFDMFKISLVAATPPDVPDESMPEPGTVTLLGAGLAAMALWRRRRA